MAEQVLENIRKMTESAFQAQQEVFRHWTDCWTGKAGFRTTSGEASQVFARKWTEACSDLLKKQRESLEVQFNSILKAIEAAFRVTQAKDPEQFLTKVIEFWQKSFESMGQVADANLRDFQVAVARWGELVSEKTTGERRG